MNNPDMRAAGNIVSLNYHDNEGNEHFHVMKDGEWTKPRRDNMNRLEELKQRLHEYLNTPEEVTEEGMPHERWGPVYFNFHDWAQKDVEYLLSEVDRLKAQLDSVYAHNIRVGEMLKRDFPAAYAKVTEISLNG